MNFGETKVIDNNELANQKLEKLKEEMEMEFSKTVDSPSDFREGLTPEEIAAIVDAGFNGEGGMGNESGNVIKNPSQAMEEAEAEIEEMKRQAQEEIEQMKQEAMFSINEAKETARKEGFDKGQEEGYLEGRELGYQQGKEEGVIEGTAEGQHSFDAMKQELREEYDALENELEEKYYKKIDDLEPKFMNTLNAIYQHIFQIDMSKNRDIIIHLISQTMRNIEGDNGYLIHVSGEDYPYVNIQKKELVAGCGIAPENVEIIEDATLGRNECMIETGGGVFDCSLGTELSSLNDELMMLAFGSNAQDNK